VTPDLPQDPAKGSRFLRAMDWLHSVGAHRQDRDEYFAMLALLESVPAGEKQKEWLELLEHARCMFDMDEGPSGLFSLYEKLEDLALPLTSEQHARLEYFGRRWGYDPIYWEDLTMAVEKYPVAILAGGLATRLRPITEKIPKVLVPVAGRPFLAHQLELLRTQGIKRAVLCLGHLGEMVEREFGDGAAERVALEYSYDGPALLGTGGALKRALPRLGEKFFVLYGDSYLPTPFEPIAESFERSGRLGLMTVYRNEGQYDTSNVVFGDGEIKIYDKKRSLPEMRHIDYGLSLFRREVFERYPADQALDLADVMRDLVTEKQLAGYEVKERFYEIGSHAGLEELDALLSRPKK
jgi:dTDP-glucose pyrophosphorylase